MKKIIAYTNYLLFCCTALQCFGQNTPPDPQSAFANWRRNNLQEKIFVHSDKDLYLTGEIAWFKIYDVDGSFHRPLSISRVAYVELMDDQNKVQIQSKIALDNAVGNGSILLSHFLHTGYYKLRCYTTWMKNSDPNFFFEKEIGIINAERIEKDSSQPSTRNFELAIFPEGGNLVEGISSKIAFHISDQYGEGIAAEGSIVDQGRDTVAQISSGKTGNGHFILKPQSGHLYIARINIPGGKIIEKQLPAALAAGTTIQLTEDNDGRITAAIHSTSLYSVYLFVHTRGIVKLATVVNLTNGQGSVTLDRKALDEGISHFTVFDGATPVCERLYFVFPDKQLQIGANLNETIYEKRAPIKLTVSANSISDTAVKGNFSVAVYRIDSMENSWSFDIGQYFLLNSDIPTQIQDAAWYFNLNGEERTQAMDDLMLTAGWRRFAWKDVMQNQKPAWRFAPEFNGQIVSVKIVDKASGIPLERKTIYCSSPGKNTKFWSATSDANGIANFELKNFYGDRQLIFQSPDSSATINYIPPFSTQFSTRKLAPFQLLSSRLTAVNRRNIYQQVEHAYNEDQLNLFGASNEDLTPFYVRAEAHYQLDRYTRFATMEEVLREYVREVNVVNYGGSFHLHVFNALNRSPFQTDPLVLLDGVAMLNTNRFMDYDPLKIKTIEVVTKKYYLGDVSFNGIVDCKTYKGDLNGFDLDAKSVILDFEGLQQQREFYSPAYKDLQMKNSRLPDFRTVLYWNPYTIFSGRKPVELEWYSSDVPGKYVVDIQGISNDGHPASTRLYFTVSK